MKRKLAIAVLVIGWLPWVLVVVLIGRDAVTGVAEFSLFVPPKIYYYGLDAIWYDLQWLFALCFAYWPFVLVWTILLIVLPTVYLCKRKS